jgi:hypothetical protein
MGRTGSNPGGNDDKRDVEKENEHTGGGDGGKLRS